MSSGTLNPASHCDIAWAGPLATHAHTERRSAVGAAVALENGWVDENGFHPDRSSSQTVSPEQALLWSNDPRIWRRVW